jgi:putative transposase
MHFEPNQIYHVYNRGNTKQNVFFTEANYIYFLNKVKTEWKNYCDVLCYCLMPNHFHFMLVPNAEGCKNIMLAGKDTHMQNLSKTIGKTLSSYTKAINLQNKITGNLFQKKTKAKLLTEIRGINDIFTNHDYVLTCFHYIHQNPLQARMVNHLKEWPFSSYLDYYDRRNGSICNKSLAFQLLELAEIDFKSDNIDGLNDAIIDRIF